MKKQAIFGCALVIVALLVTYLLVTSRSSSAPDGPVAGGASRGFASRPTEWAIGSSLSIQSVDLARGTLIVADGDVSMMVSEPTHLQASSSNTDAFSWQFEKLKSMAKKGVSRSTNGTEWQFVEVTEQHDALLIAGKGFISKDVRGIVGVLRDGRCNVVVWNDDESVVQSIQVKGPAEQALSVALATCETWAVPKASSSEEVRSRWMDFLHRIALK